MRKNIRVIEKNSGKTRRANPRENSNKPGKMVMFLGGGCGLTVRRGERAAEGV